MPELKALSLLGSATLLLCLSTLAQDATNSTWIPATRLEAFETNTDSIVLHGATPIGNVSAEGASIAVRCRQFTDLSSGHTESGASVSVARNGPTEDSALLDYEELELIAGAIDELSKLTWPSSGLSDFSASFTTKSGFRISAFGSRRSGAIDYSLRFMRTSGAPIRMPRDQLSQLRSLFEQAKGKLDSLGK